MLWTKIFKVVHAWLLWVSAVTLWFCAVKMYNIQNQVETKGSIIIKRMCAITIVSWIICDKRWIWNYCEKLWSLEKKAILSRFFKQNWHETISSRCMGHYSQTLWAIISMSFKIMLSSQPFFRAIILKSFVKLHAIFLFFCK